MSIFLVGLQDAIDSKHVSGPGKPATGGTCGPPEGGRQGRSPGRLGGWRGGLIWRVVVTAGTSLPARRVPWLRSATTRDALIAVIAFALTVLLTGRLGDPASRQVDTLGVVLIAVATLPLVARRREPLGVFVLTTAASA